MAHSSPIVRVDQGFTLTELLVPEKVLKSREKFLQLCKNLLP